MTPMEIGMVVCRPVCGARAFAIVFDEKWPDYFGIFYREFALPEEAAAEASQLSELEGWPVRRGEELAGDVVERGWRALMERPRKT